MLLESSNNIIFPLIQEPCNLASTRYAVYRDYIFLCKYLSGVILLSERHQKRAEIRDESRGHLWPGNTWLLTTPRREKVISDV